MSPKRTEFERLLAKGVVKIHLDARHHNVTCPIRFKTRSWLALNFSMRYGLTDFTISDDGVSATLSFSGRPGFCSVPWVAVYAVTDIGCTDGMAWPEDAPPEALVAPERQPAPACSSAADAPAAHPVVVATEAAGTRTTPPKRGHLRMVRPDEVN